MRAPWKDRMAALGAYAGLAPVCALRRTDRSAFVACHLAVALILGAYLVLLAGVFLLLVTVASLAMVFARPVFETLQMERIILNVTAALLLLWVFGWLLGAHRALRGRRATIPGIAKPAAWLSSTKAWRPVAAFVLAFYALVAVVAAAAAHGTAIAHSEVVPARAYMLYDDMGWVPRWVFALGFYRISRTANDRWGPGSSVVVPLTEESLAAALGEGSFVFVASHGDEDGFFNQQRWFTPDDVAALRRGRRLALVYITGCDTGRLAQQWRDVLAPARTVTFDRMSATLEHVLWLWLRGPGRINALQELG